jgi:hypothetical protein
MEWLRRWESCYPGIPPLGFILRQERPEVALRFHYFSDERRMPTTPLEGRDTMRFLLGVADRVFGPGASLPAFLVAHGAAERAVAESIGLESVLPVPEHWIARLGEFVELDDLSLHAGILRRGDFGIRRALQAVTRDEIARLALLGDSGDVMCPYDGGVDLFVSNVELRRRLQDEFAAVYGQE